MPYGVYSEVKNREIMQIADPRRTKTSNEHVHRHGYLRIPNTRNGSVYYAALPSARANLGQNYNYRNFSASRIALQREPQLAYCPREACTPVQVEKNTSWA